MGFHILMLPSYRRVLCFAYELMFFSNFMNASEVKSIKPVNRKAIYFILFTIIILLNLVFKVYRL